MGTRSHCLKLLMTLLLTSLRRSVQKKTHVRYVGICLKRCSGSSIHVVLPVIELQWSPDRQRISDHSIRKNTSGVHILCCYWKRFMKSCDFENFWKDVLVPTCYHWYSVSLSRAPTLRTIIGLVHYYSQHQQLCCICEQRTLRRTRNNRSDYTYVIMWCLLMKTGLHYAVYQLDTSCCAGDILQFLITG